jgi:hypothetical protein
MRMSSKKITLFVFLAFLSATAKNVVAQDTGMLSKKSIDSLRLIILKMGMEDQQLRRKPQQPGNPKTPTSSKQDEIISTFLFPWKSNETPDELMRRKDKEHALKLSPIIEKYGWPKTTIFGSEAAMAAFLVIQHADLDLQKKYFPLLEAAAREKEASWECVALMMDRILVREGKEQMYGTQLHSMNGSPLAFYPIFDAPNVNKRRAEMGMGTIEEYLCVMQEQ